MQRAPTLAVTTRVVARALGISVDELQAGFVPAGAGHLNAVVALRHAIYGEPASGDDGAYLTWRYRFGSALRGRGECWVMVLRGRVIGMLGTEEVRIEDDSGTFSALSTMDIAVDPQFADTGVGSWMNLHILATTPLAVTIGCNENSQHMVARLFRKLPNRRSYVHPLNFQRYLAKKAHLRAVSVLPAAVAGMLMSAWRALAMPRSGRLQLQELAQFDATYQPLLDCARRPGEVWLQKSLEFLNWRLFGNPRTQYRVWGACAAGVPVGYIAVLEQRSEGAVRQVEIVDWLVGPAYQREGFAQLCRQAIRLAIEVNAETIAVTAYHARSERLLRRFGFLRRFNEFETIAIAGADAALVDRLASNPRWFVTEINTDRDGL